MWVDALGGRQPSGGATRATRAATVYTNAPKWRREAIFVDLCTLLRPHGRPCDRAGPRVPRYRRPHGPRDARALGPEAHAAGTVTQLPIHTSSRSLCFDPRFPPQPTPRPPNLRQTMLRSCKRWRSSREEPQVRAIVGSSVPYEDVGVRGKRQMFDLGTIKGKGVTRSVSLASLVMSLEIPAAVAEISLPFTGLLLA